MGGGQTVRSESDLSRSAALITTRPRSVNGDEYGQGTSGSAVNPTRSSKRVKLSHVEIPSVHARSDYSVVEGHDVIVEVLREIELDNEVFFKVLYGDNHTEKVS